MVEKIEAIINNNTPYNNNNDNNNTTIDTKRLNYTIAYNANDSQLNVALTSLTSDESFNIILKLKLPNSLDIDEVIYRLCTFKEEQSLLIEIQEIDLVTVKSPSNIYNLFKCLVDYDEEFRAVFRDDLDLFIRNQNQLFYNNLATKSIGDYLRNDDNAEDTQIKSYWTKLFNNRHLNTNEELEEKMSDLLAEADTNMAKIYHSLIHSSQMLNVLQRERNYAIDLNKMIYERETTLRYVMDEAQLDAESVKWSAKISNLKAKQQRNFKKYLQKLYDQIDHNKAHISDNEDDDVYELNDEFDSLEPFKEKFTSVPSSKTVTDLYAKSRKLEESYTIQLGAQLKTTHNLRLIRCDIFDFCKDRFNINELEIASKSSKTKNEDIETAQLEPQAIQTAMSLYSNKLCALILLVENSFKDNSDSAEKEIIKNETSRNYAENWHYLQGFCEKNGCEFHFATIQDQQKVAFRYASMLKKNPSDIELSNMNIGDFFITKHSNLSQVHAIFHLAANEKKPPTETTPTIPTSPSTPNKTLKQSDLSSRHPVILGLRNILKACSTNNINTLTLPLLLTHKMNEEMTISWVMKRAELVLKCLKGFMIEFVQWGTQDSMTIQFVVPQGLLDETFHSLSNLIPTIFRESRTVNLF